MKHLHKLGLAVLLLVLAGMFSGCCHHCCQDSRKWWKPCGNDCAPCGDPCDPCDTRG